MGKKTHTVDVLREHFAKALAGKDQEARFSRFRQLCVDMMGYAEQAGEEAFWSGMVTIVEEAIRDLFEKDTTVVKAVIAVPGEPDANGDMFPEEVLRAIVESTPDWATHIQLESVDGTQRLTVPIRMVKPDDPESMHPVIAKPETRSAVEEMAGLDFAEAELKCTAAGMQLLDEAMDKPAMSSVVVDQITKIINKGRTISRFLMRNSERLLLKSSLVTRKSLLMSVLKTQKSVWIALKPVSRQVSGQWQILREFTTQQIRPL